MLDIKSRPEVLPYIEAWFSKIPLERARQPSITHQQQEEEEIVFESQAKPTIVVAPSLKAS